MGEREGEMAQVDVELWDCSGNREWVWPVARGSPLFIRAPLQKSEIMTNTYILSIWSAIL